MAHHKSAKKRARQTIGRTEHNKTKKSAARSAIKKVREAIVAKDKKAATEHLTTAQSLLARLAKVGVIKQGTAARSTSRLARQIAGI